MVFIDTGAWFDMLVPWAANHRQAIAYLGSSSGRFITTDYVVDELLTLLRVRGEYVAAKRFIDETIGAPELSLVHIDAGLFRRGLEVFRAFADKQWSFTDCVSYAVIEAYRIETAFAFDHHFRQFGICRVVPEI